MPDTNTTPIQPQPQTSPMASEPQDDVPILRLRAALAAVQPEMAALDPETLPRVNIDVDAACVLVRGCLPKIAVHREALVKLEGFRVEAVEKLETYVLAAQHAQTRYRSATQPPAALPVLLERMTKARERLLYDLNGMVAHGVVDGTPLREMKGVPSNVDIGAHVLVLVDFARENFGILAGKIPYAMKDLKEMEVEADELLNLIGLKQQGAPAVAKVLDDRNRAFTLFSRAYDEVRRGLTFLRWKQDDLDEIAPSLYSGRGGRGRKTDEEVTTPVVPTPAPTPGPAPAPVPPVGGNGVPLPTGPGMPGNDPFGP